MIRLENWSMVSNQNGFTAPELLEITLSGNVYGHPVARHYDGKLIQTSRPVSIKGRIVTTKSGNVYRLGKIDKGYRKWLKANVPDWDYRKPITKLSRRRKNW